MQFKVMTFNLRIDVPVDGPNQWRYRVPAVLATIQHHHPDILFLQEATPAMLDDLQRLDSEYDHYYLGRNADLKGEGCPIYFRKTHFRLRLADTIWLSHSPRTPGSMDEEEGFPRIASMVMLQTNQNQLVRFINTHLAYRSNKAKDLNLKVLFDFVQGFPQPLPTILGGDFNEVMPVIKKYAPRDFFFATTTGNTYHDFKGEPGISAIDHLLFQDPMRLQKVMIDRNEYDQRLPSDHYPIIGEFIYES